MEGKKDPKRMKIIVPFFIFSLFTSIASCAAGYVADNDGPEIDITNISDAIEEANYSRVEVVSVGSDSFDMSWVSSTELSCFFDYGLSPFALNNTLPASDLPTKYHWVAIKGLNDGTTHHYRINSSLNEINNFTTFPLDIGNYCFSFAVATDIHWSSSNSISNIGRMYKYTDRLLADVVTAINAESVNFTILLGDLTDNGLAYEFDNVTKRLNTLDKPFYPVIGNHDKSEGAWVTEWAELWQGNTTYSFNFSGWHFIVLDSVNDTNPEQGILTEDITKWLQDDLKAHKTMPSIICLHFLVNDVPGLAELSAISSSNPYIDNNKEFKVLLNNYPNVVAVLSGHGHLNSITYSNNVTFIETASVIPYPITYDIYQVYEYGFIKTQHKLYQDLNISELSRETAVNYLNDIYPSLGDQYVSFIFGSLSDRSINISFAPQNLGDEINA
ncbi:3',5'-cyclic AMP phosphodiesterase CpdA [Methanophagales archaeon]|nr:3',5'-cyclic AMP phosphodiesterase CpdA [Methanophagales archaeon]